MIAQAITLVYASALIRDRAASMRKFLWAQVAMPFWGVAAVLFVQTMTHSHLQDIGGRVDVIVMLAVALLGAIGAAVPVYTVQSL